MHEISFTFIKTNNSFSGHTPLHMAVMNNDIEVVKVLIECGMFMISRSSEIFRHAPPVSSCTGAAINARTHVANTPLHLCYDKPEIVKLLLEVRVQTEVSGHRFFLMCFCLSDDFIPSLTITTLMHPFPNFDAPILFFVFTPMRFASLQLQ